MMVWGVWGGRGRGLLGGGGEGVGGKGGGAILGGGGGGGGGGVRMGGREFSFLIARLLGNQKLYVHLLYSISRSVQKMSLCSEVN